VPSIGSVEIRTLLVLSSLVVAACGDLSTSAPATSQIDQQLQSDRSIVLFETDDPAWSPQGIATTDTSPVEVGTTFVPFVGGQVTAIQFYRGVANPSGYTVHLWTAQGNLLGSGVVIEGQGTTPGWQTVELTNPVTLQPLQTYVASYYSSTGGYAYSQHYFERSLTRGPLIAIGAGGGETQPHPGGGVYRYGSGGGFPTNTYLDSNYWVGPVFETDTTAGAAPAVTGLTDITATTLTINGSNFTPDAIAPSVWFGAVPANLHVYSPEQIQVSIPPHPPGTVHVRVLTSAGESTEVAADTFTYPGAGGTYSVFAPSVVPANPVEPDDGAVELGVRFTSTVGGSVSAVRFYRGVAIPSGYAVHLWDAAGNLLATGVAIEGQGPAPGWQTVTFGPVAIQPGHVYTASYYASTGGYAAEPGAFDGDANYQNGPLTLLSANAVGGNGVFAYGASGEFPTETYSNTNYFVDVVFTAD